MIVVEENFVSTGKNIGVVLVPLCGWKCAVTAPSCVFLELNHA